VFLQHSVQIGIDLKLNKITSFMVAFLQCVIVMHQLMLHGWPASNIQILGMFHVNVSIVKCLTTKLFLLFTNLSWSTFFWKILFIPPKYECNNYSFFGRISWNKLYLSPADYDRATWHQCLIKIHRWWIINI